MLALQLLRDLNMHYKTVFVLADKVRESLMMQRDESELDSVVEMDSAYNTLLSYRYNGGVWGGLTF